MTIEQMQDKLHSICKYLEHNEHVNLYISGKELETATPKDAYYLGVWTGINIAIVSIYV